METFGNQFLHQMQGSFYDQVANDLQSYYLREDTMDDIDEILRDMKQAAKEANIHHDGVLKAVTMHDGMDRMRWRLVIEKDGKEYHANQMALRDVFGYPIQDMSDDVEWFADVIWNLLFGDDDDKDLSMTLNEDASDDMKPGSGNIEVSDHTYDDDDDDEGSIRWHEPENNL